MDNVIKLGPYYFDQINPAAMENILSIIHIGYPTQKKKQFLFLSNLLYNFSYSLFVLYLYSYCLHLQPSFSCTHYTIFFILIFFVAQKPASYMHFCTTQNPLSYFWSTELHTLDCVPICFHIFFLYIHLLLTQLGN